MLPHLILGLAPILSLLPSVVAHGILLKVDIDGTTYTGNAPGAQPSNSPIRQVSSINPVKGASNPSLSCGLDAQLASQVVPANPGSVMKFWWANPSGSHWPHEVGPIMCYMAKCDTTCDKYNGSNAAWFKISQLGQKSAGSSTWYQQDIMNGGSVSVTLPATVAPGDYLVRHEIISLQLAVTVGGAEFYPSCTQIRVSGSQTGTPDQTVSFPGAYNDNDPGIYDPNVYNPGSIYVFPGPPLSKLASSADTTGQTNISGSASPSDSGGASTAMTNGAYSTADGAYPTTDGASPTTDGASPTTDGASPTTDGASPTTNGASPTTDGASPTTDGASPTTDGASPTPTTDAVYATSTSGSGQVCKLRKRNSASLAQRDTAIVHHKRRNRFMRNVDDAFYSV